MKPGGSGSHVHKRYPGSAQRGYALTTDALSPSGHPAGTGQGTGLGLGFTAGVGVTHAAAKGWGSARVLAADEQAVGGRSRPGHLHVRTLAALPNLALVAQTRILGNLVQRA